MWGVIRVPLSKPVALVAANAARRDAGKVGTGAGAGLLNPAWRREGRRARGSDGVVDRKQGSAHGHHGIGGCW